MTRVLHFISAWALLTGAPARSIAQPLITELGGGVGLLGIGYMHTDNTADRLLLTGWFAYANEVPVSPGILQWDTSGFTSIGCGVGWLCVNPLSLNGIQNPSRAVAIWNDELYLGGDFFFTRGGVDYNFIMRWDGEEWHPVGEVDGLVKSLKVIDGELIAAGWFTYADTVLCNGLARWDGERWHKVEDVPPYYIGDGPNMIQDVEKFQGQWYISGNLPLAKDIARWNGTEWETVGGGFTSSGSSAYRMKVHGDRLHVAGSFSRCPPFGNGIDPGSGIVAWDGEQWDDLGGGTCGATGGTVWDMTWWRDTLYACGNFNAIGGVQGGRLAKWDGNQWCTMVPPNYFGNTAVGSVAVYHDSLYVGGGFSLGGSDVLRRFGKWTGGNATFGCGNVTSVDELATPSPSFTLHPNPTTGLLQIQLHGLRPRELWVSDALGRVVLRQAMPGTAHGPLPLDLGALNSGAYLVTVLDADGMRHTQRVVRE